MEFEIWRDGNSGDIYLVHVATNRYAILSYRDTDVMAFFDPYVFDLLSDFVMPPNPVYFGGIE